LSFIPDIEDRPERQVEPDGQHGGQQRPLQVRAADVQAGPPADNRKAVPDMDDQVEPATTSRRSQIVLDLFEAYYDRVYAFARKSAEPAVAEDATQEAFIRLLQHPRLEELEISISYLLKIVHNILRRRHSRSVRLREILDEQVTPRERRRHEEEPFPFEHPTSETLADVGSLERAFSRLTDDERDALRLIVCEGRSYAHAARSLGVSVTTINNWKHRGLGKLRRHLQAEQIFGAFPESRHARTG
jgi:RNA polymerase sigma factor (sigma-70 family)